MPILSAKTSHRNRVCSDSKKSDPALRSRCGFYKGNANAKQCNTFDTIRIFDHINQPETRSIRTNIHGDQVT